MIKLYEPSPTPCPYVADVQNMVGRVPLMPLFLAGNSTPTIPHIFSKRKDSGFRYGCADAAAVYEVNPWLWRFGRGKPCLGGLTIEETTERKDAVSNARHKRAAATVRHRKEKSSLIRSTWCSLIACTRMYAYIPVCTSIYKYMTVRISIIRGCKYS